METSQVPHLGERQVDEHEDERGLHGAVGVPERQRDQGDDHGPEHGEAGG
jgi:hypothetical protein